MILLRVSVLCASSGRGAGGQRERVRVRESEREGGGGGGSDWLTRKMAEQNRQADKTGNTVLTYNPVTVRRTGKET